jgi:hypothetical protein
MTKTLKDFLPHEALDYPGIRKMADVAVVEEFGFGGRSVRWPGVHKNVHSWCVLANGKAVAWNESPSRGWSFPTMKAPA